MSGVEGPVLKVQERELKPDHLRIDEIEGPASPAPLFDNQIATKAAAKDSARANAVSQLIVKEVSPKPEQIEVAQKNEAKRSIKKDLRGEAKKMRDRAWLEMNGCWGRGARGNTRERLKSVRDYSNAQFTEFAAKIGNFNPVIDNLEKEKAQIPQILERIEDQLIKLQEALIKAEKALGEEPMINASEEEVNKLLHGSPEERARAVQIQGKNKISHDIKSSHTRRNSFYERQAHIDSLVTDWQER